MITITHLVVTAPLRIHSEANQPWREHWAVKAKRKKKQKDEITVELHNALIGKQLALPCDIKLIRIGPKQLDPDNLANGFKAVQDAIAAKLGADDGDKSKVSWAYDQEPCRVRQYSIRVELNSRISALPLE